MATMNLKYIDHCAKSMVTHRDMLFAISGSATDTGSKHVACGGVFVCDRGSSHVANYDSVMRIETKRWNVRCKPIAKTIVERELTDYRNASWIQVPSQYCRDTFVSRGIHPERVRVVHYGFDASKFRINDTDEIGQLRILFCGQVCLRKGIGYLLEAFDRVLPPKKQLIVVGIHQRDAEAIVDRHRNNPQIQFLGHVPQAELCRIMSSSTVMVMPSVEEGLPLVIGQALACGCPVIATPETGFADLLEFGKCGKLIPSRDPEAIATIVNELARDRELVDSLRQAARVVAKKMNGWSQYSKDFAALYRALMSQRNE